MRKLTLAFEPAEDPILAAVTKLGGQPTWVGEPTWPSSRESGEPMRFIGQVALDPEVFGAISARMAYIFMTDGEEYVEGTWEADGGENAVVLQPGTFEGPTVAQAQGPTAFRMVDVPDQRRRVALPCEYRALATAGEDPDPDPDDGPGDGDDRAEGFENKVGGVPVFLQGDDRPADGGPWRLLLQLDSCSAPIEVNFGDAGVGYAFLSADGARGKFLWQCC